MFVMAHLNGYKEIKENKLLKKARKEMTKQRGGGEDDDEQAASKILILNDGRSLTQNNVCPENFHA